MRIALNRLLLVSSAVALAAALVPAGLALDRRLAADLEARARSELHRAPMVLADRDKARSDALMMHAQELAATPRLAEALAAGDSVGASELRSPFAGEQPMVVGPSGSAWLGPAVPSGLVEATREGHMPVAYAPADSGIRVMALAPVRAGERWVGAAGVSQPVDDAVAATLAGLTAADVVVVRRDVGADGSASSRVVASTADSAASAAAAALATSPDVEEVSLAGERAWAVSASLGDVGRVVFVRHARRELGILPGLRRSAYFAGGLALVLALLLAGVVGMLVTLPVRDLADAADRLADGDFDAPLRRSVISEVDRMSGAFARMRTALASRLRELASANRELERREERLRTLQAEMIQRDRLVASGRLVTELAHEIRNPVANVRNCLEVVRRGVNDDPRLRDFADLAIDELLRMHELAEQMLDLNRPDDPAADRCDGDEVVVRVARLFDAGTLHGRWHIRAQGEVGEVAVSPDVLKQVLTNLVQNAREAMPGGGVVTVAAEPTDRAVALHVMDEGTGIPEDVLPHVFDPFFTTKGEARGVGLGLFVAEGLVRAAGGRLSALNRTDGPGARFTLDLPRPGGGGQVRAPADGEPGEPESGRAESEETEAAPNGARAGTREAADERS